MAVSISTEGVQTATLTTEHTLATVTTPGTYVLFVDAANLANGETLTLRLKTKGTSGDTSQLAEESVFQHAQNEKNLYSKPIPSPVEVVATLTQTGGTGRSYIWALYAL